MTSYAADRINHLATPRRLIVELGNGSSSSSRSIPTFSSSAVPECGDQIFEVNTMRVFLEFLKIIFHNYLQAVFHTFSQ